MNGGARAALGLLVILGGAVLVIYAIQGMWPIEPHNNGSEPGTRPANPGEPRYD